MTKQNILRNIIFTIGLAGTAFSAAQVMVTVSPPATTTLLHLAGSIESVAINAPEDVKAMYVMVKYQGQNIVLEATNAPANGEVILTSGVSNVVLHSCRDGVLLFSGTERRTENSLSTTMGEACIPFEDFAGGSSDPGFFFSDVEVSVDEWLPLMVYRPHRTTKRFDNEPLEPQEAFVFLLYLSSEPLPEDRDAYPQVPILSTWEDLPVPRPPRP